MRLKGFPFIVELCDRKQIVKFIEKWHYSQSMNGVKSQYCFKLTHNGIIIGAIVYADFAMASVWRKYSSARDKVIELRRLCCIDETPKNTESFFIAKTLKWLQRNTTIETVISYADDYYGHKGIIYQASNFEYLGTTSPSRMIEWNGKLWHDKTIRTRYKGRLKPYAQKIKDALLRGEAKYIKSNFKYIYRYELQNRKLRDQRP